MLMDWDLESINDNFCIFSTTIDAKTIEEWQSVSDQEFLLTDYTVSSGSCMVEGKINAVH
jgi:hypothetical protein